MAQNGLSDYIETCFQVCQVKTEHYSYYLI